MAALKVPILYCLDCGDALLPDVCLAVSLENAVQFCGRCLPSQTLPLRQVYAGEHMMETRSGDPRFYAILEEMRVLHRRKMADYGLGEDPLANLRAGEAFGIPSWIGTMVRANDKMTRIKSFCQKGKVENESVQDSLLDLACYAVLALILYRETKQ